MEIINFKNFMNEKLTKKQMKLPKALRDAIEKKNGKKPKMEYNDNSTKMEYNTKKKDKIITGLTKKQKKLPIGLQKAILKKQKTNEFNDISFSTYLSINEHMTNTKSKMMLKIYNMYGKYIDDNNISENDILYYIYNIIINNPELLDNELEKN
jgi:hypothetical protein